MSQTDPMIQYWALRLWDKFRVEEMYEELEEFAFTLRPSGSKPDNEGETNVEPEASGAVGPLEHLVP